MTMKQTPSQTVGPYFAYGLTPQQYHYPFSQIAGSQLVQGEVKGERIRITGQVFDGQGERVDDAMIEIWQANAAGRFKHPLDQRAERPLDDGFLGFGRCGTGTSTDQSFSFDTVKPGAAQDGHAPFITVVVFLRGLLSHAYTRIYFADEAAANEADPVLNKVPAERRQTLIAHRADTATGVEYRFDIHMQGPQETVFFDV
ncbi:protocatechuate 3,4-dioxygenase alpha subunit [Oceanisphaera litoralis]|uniref:protocatechuate 3,4-dioxygenase subunit alpha n=1 Tax=Oceanisphaera litoralis TaxID=225144 RepID=UPI0019597C35|nr:protocatechuate 3,4-dioxygenase subunit alpha [Oceanisphaera litoralis]MBM7456629.1 protocatechuate 3,4-dioxygenase alpha subunit [Oceanisphaera litoralis]